MCFVERKYNIVASPCSKFHSTELLNGYEIFVLKGEKTFEIMSSVKTFSSDLYMIKRIVSDPEYCL